MMQKIFGILFGKDPDIFDSKGTVVHKLPKEKWQSWQDRYQKGEEYDWHQHRGTKPHSTQPAQKK